MEKEPPAAAEIRSRGISHKAAASLPAMAWQRVAEQPGVTIFREKDRGIWKSVSWAHFGARIRAIGLALKASGFRAGDVACVLAETRLEWACVDLGILCAGGVSAGLYPTDGTDAVVRVLADSGARILFVENEQQLDKALQARAECPALERIVIFDMKGLRDLKDGACESLAAFVARGEAHGRSDAGEWIETLSRIDGDQLAMLLYTPGTSGAPKAVMLSHRNVLAQVENAEALFGQRAGDERVAFLPSAHVMERVLGLYLSLYSGTVTNYVESPETVPENLQEVRPTVMCAPPRIWEKFHSATTLAVSEATSLQRMLYRWAIGIGHRVANDRLAGRTPSFGRRLSMLAAQLLVLRKVKRAAGLDRIRVAVVGGEPVAATLLRWYLALGIDLVEIYGQTESAGLAAAMPADAMRAGYSGRPVSHGELEIGDDGEILLRGPHVSIGYWSRGARSAQSEWLKTGDIGSLDDGYVRVGGRRAEAIALQSGDAVVPSQVEIELKVSPYIADAVVIGHGREALACLVMIEQDTVERWAHQQKVPFAGFASLARDESVRDLIAREIDKVNAGLEARLAIRKFRLIEQKIEPGDPELTPMLKLRRDFLNEKYRDLIEGMYREP